VENNHREKLGVNAATHESCFLYTRHGLSDDLKVAKFAQGFTCLQTDDTASTGKTAFIKLESSVPTRFDCKTNMLEEGGVITFNGADISFRNGAYTVLTQSA
jgi:hypothetical protein